jgi:hypothetical protein
MWVTPKGKRFELSSHSPAEWGEKVEKELLQLQSGLPDAPKGALERGPVGVSPEYAAAVRADYAAAVRE